MVKDLIAQQDGQDLIEYTLLMVFIALASAALLGSAGGPIAGMWASVNGTIASANALTP